MRRMAMTAMFVAIMLVGVERGTAADAQPTRADPVAKAEGKTVDVKARVKALIAEALKAEDLWTALQLDAYAQARLAAKPAVHLGSSEIIGDPLFAFPSRVQAVWERGDAVGVVAGSRYYHLAPDGRPLALATPLMLNPQVAALSADGKWLAYAERQRLPSPLMHIAVRGVPGGAGRFHVGIPFVAGDSLWSMTVADDGSAAMVAVMDEDEVNARLFVARANGKGEVVPGFFRPHGMGAGGTWLLAEPLASRGADHRQYALIITGAKPLLSGAAAVGGGMAAIVTGDPEAGFAVKIAKPDGVLTVLPVPAIMTRSARLRTVGGWLLVGTGAGGKTEDGLDFLGNPTKGEHQPFTTFAYRWKDLADPLKAQPIWQSVSHPAISEVDPATIYAWRDQQVVAVDFSGTEPQERAFATSTAAIDGLEFAQQRLKIVHEKGSVQIVDTKGQELWAGTCTGTWLSDPQWMLVRSGRGDEATWRVVHLDPDPQARSDAQLQLEPGAWEITIDRYGRRAVAVLEERWIELDPITGKARRQSAPGVRAPQVELRDDPHGRFARVHARLVDKTAPPATPSDDPLRRLAPRDAWRVGQTLLVLDRTGQVIAPGRKRGTYVPIGTCEAGDHFVLLKGSLAIANEDEQVIAGFAPGPVLTQDLATPLQPAEPLPPGPWRVEGLNFASPKSGLLTWDAVRAGFTPRWLRSPPGSSGMLIVTASLIIDLDPAYARLFGSPLKELPERE